MTDTLPTPTATATQIADNEALIDAQETFQQKLRELPKPVKIKRIGEDFDMTPTVFQWTCPYCHKGYETTSPASFKVPAQMVCRACCDAYDAKVTAGFVLEEINKQTAYRVANLDRRSMERKEVIGRWHRFAGTSASIHDRLKYQKMILLVNECDTGHAVAPAKQQKKGKSW